MGKYGYSVFVGNLSRRVRRDDLKDTFRDMGRIIEVDIKTGYGEFYILLDLLNLNFNPSFYRV